MADEATIANLLMTRLGTLPAQTPAVDIAFPDLPFTPTLGKTYLEARFLPNRNVNYGLGDEGPTQHLGLFQVTVCHAPGRGAIGPLTIAGAIVEHFYKGLRLWSGNVAVKVYEKPSVGPSIQDADRVRYPVTVRYTASV
jgi:hypothetical protein